MPRTSVLIVDEHLMFREAVKVVLEASEDIDVIGEADGADEAIELAKEHQPTVILLDALRNGDGVKAAEALCDALPDVRVLMLSSSPDEEILTQAIEAGAAGYITKESPLTELLEATRTVARGEVLIPKGMLGGLLRRLIRRRRDEEESRRRQELLTKREREVLTLLARGANNEKIASILVISPQTARTHVQNILSKLGVHSRLEAASYAIRHGLVESVGGAV